MGSVIFYHLTRSTVEQTLPQIIARSLTAGWRVAVRGADRARLEWLDEKLWLGSEEDFLPHGLAGGPHDADQPILLTDRPGLPNGARCLIAIDGAAIDPAEAEGLERACLIFDGGDASTVEAARGQWRAVTAAGLAAQYWSEESGRWEKKQERAAAG
ncbi:DNA polymerase III subunit chi [Tabrizicola sp. J26]|uniref:DNA polymerase III subunit chi n=1 Tax=Alitabrizicola rongguiensis TaxID=2909234 RepID=UPI001F192276|nr:DNA polymerase III subunit chi [Tabrizicola rongguiensis]MCF1709964.1 DNA polymerase III subunit chi [Tabrizicola rongguiensis]